MNKIKEAILDYWEYLSSPDTVTGLFLTWCIAFLLLLCVSCANPSYNSTQQPKYEEIICPKCEGTGTVPQTTSQKIGFAIVTFGMTLMTDDEQRCPKCHGSGYVRIPILEEKYE